MTKAKGSRKANEMTEWDAGQILTALQDHLCEAINELSQFNPEAASALNRMRLDVGDLFNARHCGKSHAFGLAGHVFRADKPKKVPRGR